MRMNLLSLLALSFTLFLPACSDGSDSDGESESGDSDGDGGDGACAGPITECRLAELSEQQQATYCETLLAVIDDEPGTKYACESDGTFLTLNTTADCIASKVSPECPITVGDLIDCYRPPRPARAVRCSARARPASDSTLAPFS